MPVLTDVKVRSFKPKNTTYRIADTNGLALEIKPSGVKSWRYRYRFAGKANMLSLGHYPQVSLAEARRRREEARSMLDRGVDPSEQRKAARMIQSENADNSFEAVAREWFGKNAARWSEGNVTRTSRLFEKDLFPWIGGMPIADVTAPTLLFASRPNCGRAVSRGRSGDSRG